MFGEMCEAPVFHIPLRSLEQVVSNENNDALWTPVSPFMLHEETKNSSPEPIVIAQAQ